MSQENVEIVKGRVERGTRETWMPFASADPDVILRPTEGWPEPGPYWGGEAVMRFRAVRDTWDADALEPISDFIDGADRVVVRFGLARPQARGPESNIELTCAYAVARAKYPS